MKNKYFSVLPIGGVEEIGSNMTLIKTPSEDIVIDCGLLFPYEECFDINYLIPDFSQIDPTRLKAIFITHGHEDHIGGLGHFLQAFPETKVYATKFTLHLIQRKLESFNVKLNYELYYPDSEIEFKDINFYPIHVNHSIPETNGVVIRTKNKEWGALYISDFKVDLTSKHEAPIDFTRIKKLLGECTYSAYFMDSTNILNDGKTVSENTLVDDLDELMKRKNNRIYITLFASNVHRMNAIALRAKAANRKLVIMGRSLRTYMESAFETGHAGVTPDELFLPEQVKGDTGKMLIFLSGCQGDFLSALRRFSYGEDSTFKPGPGDLIVFSSKVIPGNEKKVSRIYNKLTEFGADIVTASDKLIHASGHPGKEDLKLLLDNFQPTYYFPIHGESYFLRKHKEFIEENYPEISAHLIYNYQEVILADDTIKTLKHEHIDPHLIHGKNLEIEKTQISQRRKMATQGAVFISLHKNSLRLEITTIGLPLMAQEHLETLKEKVLKQIKTDLINRDENYLKDQVKISTRQFYNNILGYKPVTEMHVF